MSRSNGHLPVFDHSVHQEGPIRTAQILYHSLTYPFRKASPLKTRLYLRMCSSWVILKLRMGGGGTPHQILCVLQKSERTKENAFKRIRDDDIGIIMLPSRQRG